ncbi:MAG: L,D-transpeptidase/peptidoglycan binding protein [Actinomycetota bacterium]
MINGASRRREVGAEQPVGRGRHAGAARGRGWTVAAVAVAVLVVLGGGTAYAAYRYERTSATRILPGVSIDGVDVGGMTRDEAVRAVSGRAGTVLTTDLVVRAAGHVWLVTPSALGAQADVEGAVDRAFAVADSMSLLSRVYHRVAHKPVSTSVELGLAYDEAAVRSFVRLANDEAARRAVNAGLVLVDNELVVRRSKPGLELKQGAAVSRVKAALERREYLVTLPIKRLEPTVTAATLGKTIVVDLSENMLYLYESLRVLRQYPVATAAPGYVTPVGTWKVVRKVENPGWYNPAPTGWGAGAPLYIPPGPGNPLGTRALYLNAPGIRIHGTYASYSIGMHISHGCIRMFISDSEELYPLVPIGTKVIIKP